MLGILAYPVLGIAFSGPLLNDGDLLNEPTDGASQTTVHRSLLLVTRELLIAPAAPEVAVGAAFDEQPTARYLHPSGERRIYLEELEVLLEAHAPQHADELVTIGICESGRFDYEANSWYVRPDALGDNGRSLGWLQLWEGWPQGLGLDLDPMDPEEAIRLAVAIRENRGAFGGPGGWTCADLMGIA